MTVQFSVNAIDFSLQYPPECAELVDFFVTTTPPTNSTHRVSATISLTHRIEPPPNSHQLSHALWQSAGSIAYRFHGDLLIQITSPSDDVLHIDIAVRQSQTLRSRARRAVTGTAGLATRNNYVQALRHAVLYPYFVLMQRRHNTMVSHGTAFSYGDQCCVLLGYEGIGKSTIAAQARTAGATLLTDNFILINDTDVYYVPDPLRVNSASASHGYGKQYDAIPCIDAHRHVTHIVFTYLGKSYRLEPIDTADIERHQTMFMSFLPEFCDLRMFTDACAFLTPTIPHAISMRLPKAATYLICERAVHDDNRRLLSELGVL